MKLKKNSSRDYELESSEWTGERGKDRLFLHNFTIILVKIDEKSGVGKHFFQNS